MRTMGERSKGRLIILDAPQIARSSVRAYRPNSGFCSDEFVWRMSKGIVSHFLSI